MMMYPQYVQEVQKCLSGQNVGLKRSLICRVRINLRRYIEQRFQASGG